MPDIRDFYMRNENDPKFVKDQIEVYDDLEATLNQIKMTLLTNKGEVLGEPNFGLQIEKYLFEFEVDPFGLANEATSQMETYVPESKKRRITVTPAKMLDSVGGREVFVLSINLEEQKNAFAILYS